MKANKLEKLLQIGREKRGNCDVEIALPRGRTKPVDLRYDERRQKLIIITEDYEYETGGN